MSVSARAVAGWTVGTFMVSWAFSACLSPTLPLPPPGAPEIAELSADRQTVRIVGRHAVAGADVIVMNRDTPGAPGLVVFADSSGGYVFEKLPVDLSVSATNIVEIWQTYGSDRSEPVTVAVPKGVAFGAAPIDDDAGAATTTQADSGESGAIDAPE